MNFPQDLNPLAQSITVSLTRLLPRRYTVAAEEEGAGQVTFRIQHDGDTDLPPHVFTVTTRDMRAFRPCLSLRRQRWKEATWAGARWEHSDGESVSVMAHATPDDIASAIAGALYTELLSALTVPAVYLQE